MSYPYDQYLAGITGQVTDPYTQNIRQTLLSGGAVGIGTTALEALDYVKNGHMCPMVTFDPYAPIAGTRR